MYHKNFIQKQKFLKKLEQIDMNSNIVIFWKIMIFEMKH